MFISERTSCTNAADSGGGSANTRKVGKKTARERRKALKRRKNWRDFKRDEREERWRRWGVSAGFGLSFTDMIGCVRREISSPRIPLPLHLQGPWNQTAENTAGALIGTEKRLHERS